MGGHNHVGIDAQVFFSMTKVETLYYHLAWFVADKDREPLNNTKSDKVDGTIRGDVVPSHSNTPFPWVAGQETGYSKHSTLALVS